MKNILPALLITAAFLFQQCTSGETHPKTTLAVPAEKDTTTTVASPTPTDTKHAIDDAATIMARKEIPVLCYHHIRNWKPNERASMKDYIVQVADFKAQMKALADSGYHTISPDQLYNYLTTGAALPSKPVVLTYDDTDEEQYSIAAPEMDKYGFKGVYFIMTISIGRPNYMTKEQIKELADKGHTIGGHTWDHHDVRKYEGEDWDKQFTTPKEKLEAITGKPVNYFAYPFGAWNERAIPELNKRGYIAAFQLSTKRDPQQPLYTVRRILVAGTWSVPTLMRAMNNSFH